MRVIVEADVFRADRGPRHHGDLLDLFRTGTKGYHAVEIDEPRSTRYRAWLDAEGKSTRAMCELALTQGRKLLARRKMRTLRIADIDTPSWGERRFPLDIAMRILRRPLALLLENGRNDARFLGVITRLAGDFDLDRYVREDAIRIMTNGGVDENRAWLDEESRSPEDFIRLWVICDSDARRAWQDASGRRVEERLSKQIRDMLRVCKERGVTIHVLRRRAIDNYIPAPALERWSQLRDQDKRGVLYAAFAKLGEEQRHHYNMKEGFARDAKDREYTAKVGDLYDGLAPDVRQVLLKGFNTRDFKVTDLFEGKEVPLQERWFQRDHQEEEALRIVESIRELL